MELTKQSLFDYYMIDASHKEWKDFDNFISVDLYLMMNNKLPENDTSLLYVLEFLKIMKDPQTSQVIMANYPKKWGAFFIVAKKMVYRYHEQILEELRNGEQGHQVSKS
jgi:hypothetical protein